MIVSCPHGGVVDDAGGGEADAALRGLVGGFVGGGAKEGDDFSDRAGFAGGEAEFAQDDGFADDDAEEGNGGAILGEVAAEIDAEVEEFVAGFQGGAGRGVEAFDEGLGHVRADEGELEFEDHGVAGLGWWVEACRI